MTVKSIKEIHERLLANFGELDFCEEDIELDFNGLDELSKNIAGQSVTQDPTSLDKDTKDSLSIVVDNSPKSDEDNSGSYSEPVGPIVRQRRIKRSLYA
jgi:hypothetical protein